MQQIAAGDRHNIALMNTGDKDGESMVFSWGGNEFYQLGTTVDMSEHDS